MREYSDEEVLGMLHRNDYYMILKIRRNPEEAQQIKWNTKRNNWMILHTYKRI